MGQTLSCCNSADVENKHESKGFVFYGVTFDLCRFCTYLNLPQLVGWAKFKNVHNLHKSKVTF